VAENKSQLPFYRAQAERARRLAAQLTFANPAVSQALEALAQEFDQRAAHEADDRNANDRPA